MTRAIRVHFLVLLVFPLLLLERTQLSAQVTLQNAFPNLSFSSPVVLCAAPDTSNRIFVVSQDGVIYVFPNQESVTSSKTFLDISSTVVSGGEKGLLGLAFHPDYQTNGYFYVYYTTSNASRISRFRVSTSNRDSAVATSEVVFMSINQPFDNHKGGQLAFSPRDGYLYAALGDGGSGGDPFGNGQKRTTWLGKILRINVDSASLPLHYSIPSDNPFVSDPTPGVKKEIFAYGLRNPWRFSFDQTTGTLWAGDVGQDTWEEVDTIVNGGNYGWNIMEATHCYEPSSGCDTTGLRMPILEYGHVDGQCSITGGYVYRGPTIPALDGFYVYGDYCSGHVWSFDTRFAPSSTNTLLLNSGKSISAFGVDKNNELYLCSYGDGQILKFVALPPPTPALLRPADGQADMFRNLTLVWAPAFSASAYHLQVSTDSLFQTITIADSTMGDTTKQIGTLSYSTRYYWRVNASNSGGASAYSSAWRFRTLDSVAPPPPVLLSPSNGAIDEPSIIRLRWAKVATAASYRCQLALDSTFGTIIVDDTALTDTFRQVGLLMNDTTYYWEVRSRNDVGAGAYSLVRSFRTFPSSMIFHLLQGWNLISVPLAVENPATHVLYAGAASNAFAYIPATGYAIRDSLRHGIGYWIRYPDTATISIAGTPLSLDSVDVSEGWNLVGSIGVPLAVRDIQSSPPGLVTSQFFGYMNSYFPSDSIHPGSGYWVKSIQSGKLFFNGSGSAAIHIQPISELPPAPPETNIEHRLSDTPQEFVLDQNYPNPFNPVTVIQYALPENARVGLRVYNALGQVVRILVGGVETAGYKSVQFDATGLSSGTYFYRLDVVSIESALHAFSTVKKMVVAK